MLSDKDRELISIGASMAAGCEPCANFHLHAARIAEASDAEISQAVNGALRVRRHPTEGMAQLAARYVGGSTPDVSGGQTNRLVSELTSISTASAVNSIPDLETHVAAAQSLGAAQGQILNALKIARAVKATAAGKVEETTGRATKGTPRESADCSSRCGCHSQVESRKK